MASAADELLIRPATEADIDAILDIYNHQILTSSSLFILEPVSRDNRLQWLRGLHDKGYPCLVAQVGDQVAGYCSLGQFRDKAAYDGTAEFSLYLSEAFHRRQIGTKLFRALLHHVQSAAEIRRFHVIIGMVTSENTSSMAFCQREGFSKVGSFHRVGFKFGRFLDVVAYELLLD